MKSLTFPLTLILTSWLTAPWCIFSEELQKSVYVKDSLMSKYLQKRSPLDIGGQRRRTFDRNPKNKYTSQTNILDSAVTTSSSNSDFSYNSDSNNAGEAKNNSWKTFTGNPEEYTIGGVLSTEDVEFYFIQVLSVSHIFFVYVVFLRNGAFG